MKFQIYSNLNNGAGLQKDWELISGILRNYGHEVVGVDINRWRFQPYKADINIFLEIIEPAMLAHDIAKKNWLVPNSEWWGTDWDQLVHRFDKILCKTKDCYEIWCRKAGQQKCVYTGWEARDLYNDPTARIPQFLHLAGKSETKNTAAVTEAWKKYRLPYQLTVSAFKPEIVKLCFDWEASRQRWNPIPNVRHVERLTEAALVEEMNRHIFHIMPSKYEGFGMAIHEALSCHGIVITTNAPPMNQFKGVASELAIPVSRRDVRGPTFFNIVSAENVAAKVKQAASLSMNRILELSGQARKGFEEERQFFRNAIDGVIREANI